LIPSDNLSVPEEALEHPLKDWLNLNRFIFCPGCLIGTVITSITTCLKERGLTSKDYAVVSGIGCTGRASGCFKAPAFHTTHGRAIPFATGLKLANPKLTVVVYSGDGDLFAIGGNHFIHAARRNIDIKVICINNFTYAMTGGQVAPTTPLTAISTTSPYGCYEKSFNLPYLAESSGAVYVARWTAYHVKQIEKSITEALKKKGFSFIEILSPCPTLYGRRNREGSGLDTMKFYRENSVIKHNANTKDTDIEIGRKIIVGRFIDKTQPTYIDRMDERLSKILGPKYVKFTGE